MFPIVLSLDQAEQQFRQGLDYFYGTKGEKNFARAQELFNASAAGGNGKAGYFSRLVVTTDNPQPNQTEVADEKYEIPSVGQKIGSIGETATAQQFRDDAAAGHAYAYHAWGYVMS